MEQITGIVSIVGVAVAGFGAAWLAWSKLRTTQARTSLAELHLMRRHWTWASSTIHRLWRVIEIHRADCECTHPLDLAGWDPTVELAEREKALTDVTDPKEGTTK